MTPDELKKLRDELGYTAIAHELRRILRLIQHARRPSRTPQHEYDDLEVMFEHEDDEDDEEED